MAVALVTFVTLIPPFFAATAVGLRLVSGRCLPLFFSRAVEVDGCASSFKLFVLRFCPRELFKEAIVFAAVLQALREERKAAALSFLSNSALYGYPVNSVADSALRVRARTPEIFGRGEIAEISNRAVTTQIHENI